MEPTFVKAWDIAADKPLYGICYNGMFICACCGGTIPMVDLVKESAEVNHPVEYLHDDWENFTKIIEECFYNGR